MSVIESALTAVRNLHPYTPGKPVEELERELGIKDIIKLASNENPLGCSPLVKKALFETSQAIELYPDANAYYLKQALAEYLNIDKDQITIGNGSNDVLDLVARTFLDSNSEAIFSQYAFLVYALVTQACGATARISPALPIGHEQAYGHDLEAMLALINDKTRVIFIANPNNPTGNWLTGAALKSFLDQVPDHIAIVVDEAYFEYVEEPDYPNALKWLGNYPNLIVTRTFSKIYGLAGLRVGYAVSSSQICDLLNRIRQPFNGNAVGLAAARVALSDLSFVEASRNNNRAGLMQLTDYFDSRQLTTIRSVGNFVTVQFGPKSSEIYQALLLKGIIVRPLGNYGLAEFLRISIGTRSQNSRLIEVLDNLI